MLGFTARDWLHAVVGALVAVPLVWAAVVVYLVAFS